MQRPGLLVVGVMLAAGAGLALATPASAAPRTTADHPHGSYCGSHYWHHHRHHHNNFYDCYWDNGWGYGNNGWWGPYDGYRGSIVLAPVI